MKLYTFLFFDPQLLNLLGRTLALPSTKRLDSGVLLHLVDRLISYVESLSRLIFDDF